MKIQQFTTNLFQENTFVLWSDKTNDAIIIDPGMMNNSERDIVDKFIADKKLKVNKVLLTHAHIDHAASAAYISTKYGCEVFANLGDNSLAEGLPMQAQMFHLKIDVQPLVIHKYLIDGDVLTLGDEAIEVIATPGHSLGGLVYYLPEQKTAIVGDTIFQRSIGRTDLPGGNFGELIESIKTKVFKLPHETVLIPGHGPSTTVGEEIRCNPYLQ